MRYLKRVIVDQFCAENGLRHNQVKKKICIDGTAPAKACLIKMKSKQETKLICNKKES